MSNTMYYKTSKITGKKFDVFKCVKILNIQQVIYFLKCNVPLQDLEISEDRNTGKPVMVFYFFKDDTKKAFDEWCSREH